MTAHLEKEDMSFTALETKAADKLQGTMHSYLEENGAVCLTNGPDIRQENMIEGIEETMLNPQENGVMCSSNGQDIVIEEVENYSSNGMDARQELHLLIEQSHKDSNAVEELSQSLEEITIETTEMAGVDIDKANNCSEGCAQHLTNNLVVAALDNSAAAIEGGNCNSEEEIQSMKPCNFTTVKPSKGQKPASPETSLRCGAHTITQNKYVHEETESGKPLTKVLNSKNNSNHLSPSCSSTAKASSSKFTTARPFALATDRRAEERPAATLPTCPPSDLPQEVKNLRQKFFVAKSSHSNNIQNSVSQDPKVQTNAMGFTFRSDERAKKRKEFYSKLQEKNNAKEEEKTQMRARTEKEDEEALKVLRRSLTFKASPMPSFYQEGFSPKAEPKKIPTTQAKSPKFSNRSKSVGSKSASSRALDAEHSDNDGLGWHLASNVADMSNQSKELLTTRLEKCFLSDLRTEKISNSNLKDEGAAATDEMKERNCGESALMISNEGPTKARQVGKGGVTKEANSERHERFQGKFGSNVLRNCANKSLSSSSSMSNKMKPKVLHHQPLLYDMKEDVSPKANKTTKKERLKALTPYFRKRESIGNTRKPTTILTEREFPLM